MSHVLNADPAASIRIDTRQAPWRPTAEAGCAIMPLDAFEDGRATYLIRLAPGATWTPAPSEVLVLEGTVSAGARALGPGGYFLVAKDGETRLAAPEGARLYVKRGPRPRSLALDTAASPWLPGLTPGLSHKPLYHARGSAEAAAIVRWAPGTRVGDHDHPGGEEVFVLEGVFSDEHGDYPAGTWYRSADQSRHTPFTREGCVILARTGALPGTPAPPDPAGAEEETATHRRYAFERPFPCDFEALAERVAALALPGWRGFALTVEELYLLFDRAAPPPGPAAREKLTRLVAEANPT